jgi:hypothetical protein
MFMFTVNFVRWSLHVKVHSKLYQYQYYVLIEYKFYLLYSIVMLMFTVNWAWCPMHVSCSLEILHSIDYCFVYYKLSLVSNTWCCLPQTSPGVNKCSLFTVNLTFYQYMFFFTVHFINDKFMSLLSAVLQYCTNIQYRFMFTDNHTWGEQCRDQCYTPQDHFTVCSCTVIYVSS